MSGDGSGFHDDDLLALYRTGGEHHESFEVLTEDTRTVFSEEERGEVATPIVELAGDEALSPAEHLTEHITVTVSLADAQTQVQYCFMYVASYTRCLIGRALLLFIKTLLNFILIFVNFFPLRKAN